MSKRKPLPEIKPCIYCGGKCRLYNKGPFLFIICTEETSFKIPVRVYPLIAHGCGYQSPYRKSMRGAINVHNRVSVGVRGDRPGNNATGT